MISKKNIVLVGGGTGGHIYPLVSVFDELIKNQDFKFFYFGSGSPLEAEAFEGRKILMRKVPCGKFRRNFGLISFLQNLFDLFVVLAGIIKAYFMLREIKPAVIFSKGGFVALPTVIAGWLLRIPVISHESDIMMGLANRLVLRMVKKVGVGFPFDGYDTSIIRKAFYCGIPLKEDFKKIYQKGGTGGDYVLVIGGSSGAVSLNSKVLEVIGDLLEDHKVVHLTGRGDFKRVSAEKEKLSKELQEKYEIIEYSFDMPKLISNAEVVISRCGATSIQEIASCRKKAIFVPIPESVTAHQLANSWYLEARGYAEVVKDDRGGKFLLEKMKKLSDRKINSQFSDLYFPESAKLIAETIIEEIEAGDIKAIKKVFLIGIGGVAMKGLARILESMGKIVRGSDLKSGGHSADNITTDYDVVVYSSAAGPDSLAAVEHQKANALKIPILKRSKMIGKLMRNKTGIVISGMHGKTTITTLLVQNFDQNQFDPSYIIGADPTTGQKSAKLGSGNCFICEGCEYDRSFLDFKTTVGVISNIEEEHLDYFKGGLAEIIETFDEFVNTIVPGGGLVYCYDDKNTRELVLKNREFLEFNRIKTVSYGTDDEADVRVMGYSVHGAQAKFSLRLGEEKIELNSKIAGIHFAKNCAAAWAVSSLFNLNEYIFQDVIKNFKGAKRRFEFVGEQNGVKIYDDYAHHPTEIKATLQGLKQFFPSGRIFVVFQPHQQSRFNEFFSDFISSLADSKVEQIILLPVYKVAGRDEKAKHGCEELAYKLKDRGVKAEFVDEYTGAVDYLRKIISKGDIVITMGATDIWRVSVELLK